ncbi:MAG: hypothetical protein JSU91_01815 [Thermoplasmatales archaeon]|nr:MAG: hypothetical protein JSU91_01815 [Thermoplasmatales archaeon]
MAIQNLQSNELGLNVLQTNFFSLIESPQDLTGDWADIGDEINLQGFGKLGVFLDLDINDSIDVEIRAVARFSSSGDNYTIPNVFGVSGSYSFTDADQKIQLIFETSGVTPYIQLQVKSGTPGASVGNIASINIIKAV